MTVGSWQSHCSFHAGKDTDRNSGYFLAPEDQAVPLARYIIARYDAHHVLWDLWRRPSSTAEGALLEGRWRKIFEDGRRHPVTLHPYGMDWALYDFVDEPWMDVVGYQSAHGDNEAYLRWIPEGPPSHSWNLHQRGPSSTWSRPTRDTWRTTPASRSMPPPCAVTSTGVSSSPRRQCGLRWARRLGVGRRHRYTLRPRPDRTITELAGGAPSAGRDLDAASDQVDGLAPWWTFVPAPG